MHGGWGCGEGESGRGVGGAEEGGCCGAGEEGAECAWWIKSDGGIVRDRFEWVERVGAESRDQLSCAISRCYYCTMRFLRRVAIRGLLCMLNSQARFAVACH